MSSARIRVSPHRSSPVVRLVCTWVGLTLSTISWGVGDVAYAQPLLAPPQQVFIPPTAIDPGLMPSSSNSAAPVTLPPASELLPIPLDGAVPMDQLTAEPPPVVIAVGMPWETSIEFGLNGSSGTSESVSLRAGGHVLRESRFSKLDLDAVYNHTTSGGDNTQDNADVDVRNDWLLDDKSPWTLFATGETFYDKFQAYDLQTNANTGVGYRFFHGPMLELIGRLGMGASREFGGPDDRWVPESLVALEYSHRFSKRQKATAKVDYYPEWDQVGEFRLVADAGWEIALDQPSNVCLKLAASDRIDSTSGGGQSQLANYSVLLLIKL